MDEETQEINSTTISKTVVEDSIDIPEFGPGMLTITVASPSETKTYVLTVEQGQRLKGAGINVYGIIE